MAGQFFRELETFVRTKLKQYDYQEVKGPFMMDRVLWEKTGHWQNYADLMFTTNLKTVNMRLNQ